jgi:hypothetical protein
MGNFTEIGGEWTQEWRHLKVELSGWIDARYIRTGMVGVHKAARQADQTTTKGSLWQLQQAVTKLEKEVSNHAVQLARFQSQVGYFVAAVVQARALNANQPDELTPYEQERQEAAAQHDAAELGLDRIAEFYGINRKPAP